MPAWPAVVLRQAMPDAAKDSLPEPKALGSGTFPTLQQYRNQAREALEASYLDRLVAAAGGDPERGNPGEGAERHVIKRIILNDYKRTGIAAA